MFNLPFCHQAMLKWRGYDAEKRIMKAEFMTKVSICCGMLICRFDAWTKWLRKSRWLSRKSFADLAKRGRARSITPWSVTGVSYATFCCLASLLPALVLSCLERGINYNLLPWWRYLFERWRRYPRRRINMLVWHSGGSKQHFHEIDKRSRELAAEDYSAWSSISRLRD